MHAELQTDSLDDLGLAVTEASGALMSDGTASELTVEFDWAPGTVNCRISANEGSRPVIAMDQLRQAVLRTVSSEYRITDDPAAISLTVSTSH